MSKQSLQNATATFFYKFDMFAAPVPVFNIRGQTEVRTFVGSFMSVSLMMVTILFAIQKLQVMLLRKRPDIIVFTDDAGTDSSLKFNVVDQDFMMAFSASQWDKGARTDSRYIQWLTTVVTATKDSYTEVNYPMHRCTDADFDNFYPIAPETFEKVTKFKDDGRWFCFDIKAFEDITMHGRWVDDDDYQSFDFRMIPCASQYTAFDGTVHGGSESCIWDKNQFMEWLGSSVDVMALHNQP